jgi:hypothetical protein
MSVDFPAEEEAILKRWREIDAFRRQVELSKGKKPYSESPSKEAFRSEQSLMVYNNSFLRWPSFRDRASPLRSPARQYHQGNYLVIPTSI